jgi:hypothetical protein
MTENNGLPAGISQAEYDTYVMDMSEEMPYDPDDATLEDMNKAYQLGQNVMMSQNAVFNKSYLDSVLYIDTHGSDKAVCSLMSIAGESRVLQDPSQFSVKGQAAMSYYVLNRMDALKTEFDETGNKAVYNKGLSSLYSEYCQLNQSLTQENTARAAVLSEGVEMLFMEEVGKDSPYQDNAYIGVHYPSCMWTLDDAFKNRPLNMGDCVTQLMNDKSDSLDAVKLVVQDRFAHYLPQAEMDSETRDYLFKEVSQACDVLEQSGIIYESDTAKALLGHTMSDKLEQMGFSDYVKQHENESGLSDEERKSVSMKLNSKDYLFDDIPFDATRSPDAYDTAEIVTTEQEKQHDAAKEVKTEQTKPVVNRQSRVITNRPDFASKTEEPDYDMNHLN